jgi:DNA adenine methylase
MSRPTDPIPPEQAIARPFLKWPGGKSQLIAQLDPLLPRELKQGSVRRYVEPFLGAGALFLHVAQHYRIGEALLSDVNEELCLVWRVVQRDPEKLIVALERLRRRFLAAAQAKRADAFYRLRNRYNATHTQFDHATYSPAWVERAAQTVLLNKTCYNGLFRFNSKGEFNAPFGRYSNPSVFDPRNIRAVSSLLARATIVCGDFELCGPFVDERTFVYFDPPYRPLSSTASFTSYSKNSFGEDEQRRLGRFYRRLNDRTGARLMLSNSDPANTNPADRFFHELYKTFRIHHVQAGRAINSKAGRRGKITELVVTSY